MVLPGHIQFTFTPGAASIFTILTDAMSYSGAFTDKKICDLFQWLLLQLKQENIVFFPQRLPEHFCPTSVARDGRIG